MGEEAEIDGKQINGLLEKLTVENITKSIYYLGLQVAFSISLAYGSDYLLKDVILKDEQVKLNPSQRELIRTVVFYVIIVTGIFTALKVALNLGFNELAVSFGALSLVTSLALKGPLQNLIASMVYFFTNQVTLGDDLHIIVDPTNTVEGKIVDRDAFTYRLETEDGRFQKIPSGFLVERPVTLKNDTRIMAD